MYQIPNKNRTCCQMFKQNMALHVTIIFNLFGGRTFSMCSVDFKKLYYIHKKKILTSKWRTLELFKQKISNLL